MRRVASVGENAAMKSFVALRQRNVLDRRAWVTTRQPPLAIVIWIEYGPTTTADHKISSVRRHHRGKTVITAQPPEPRGIAAVT